jgi:hypothetical protein
LCFDAFALILVPSDGGIPDIVRKSGASKSNDRHEIDPLTEWRRQQSLTEAPLAFRQQKCISSVPSKAPRRRRFTTFLFCVTIGDSKGSPFSITQKSPTSPPQS